MVWLKRSMLGVQKLTIPREDDNTRLWPGHGGGQEEREEDKHGLRREIVRRRERVMKTGMT